MAVNVPRIHRTDVIRTDHFLLTVGATDATTTVINIYAPCAGARVIRFFATSHTAGTGTGSFTMILKENVAGTALTDALTIDPDAAADVTHVPVKGASRASDAVKLVIDNTKTGTVSNSPVLNVQIIWGA